MYKFYYINMKDSTIRNELMKKTIKKVQSGYSRFKRFEAFDNKLLNNDIINILKENKYLSHNIQYYTIMKNKVKLCIYMSHLLLWSVILKDYKKIPLDKKVHIPEYIVLEDDIKLKFNIEIMLDKVLKHIPRDYDILFIGYAGKLVGTQINNYIVRPVSGQLQDTNHGLFGYIINPNSIEKLMKLLLPIDSLNIKGNWQVEGSIIPHMDWKIRHFYNKEINAYYLKHPLVIHLEEFDNM